MNDPQLTSDEDRLERSTNSTASARKRFRFSSLRNPFRPRDTSSNLTRSNVDPNDSVSRRNRTELFSRRRRTRATIGNGLFEPQAQLSPIHPPSFSLPSVQASSGDLATCAVPVPTHSPDSGHSPVCDPHDARTSSAETGHGTAHTPVLGDDLALFRTSTSLPSLSPPVLNAQSIESHLGRPNLGPIVPSTQPLQRMTSDPSSPETRLDSDESAQTSSDSRQSRSSINDSTESGDVVSPMPGEDQAGMLSRLLSVAAAATAASLVGTTNSQALRDAREDAISAASQWQGDSTINTHIPSTPPRDQRPSDDDSDLVDGSFDGFLAALQSGRLAQALRNGGNVMGGGANVAGAPSLNFFRMFRFSSAVSIEGAPQPSEGETRQIPIIIVGIRSVPSRDDNSPPELGEMPPFLDVLGLSPDPRTNRPATAETADSARSGIAVPDDGASPDTTSSIRAPDLPIDVDEARRDDEQPIASITDGDPQIPEVVTSSPLHHVNSTGAAEGDATRSLPGVATSVPSPRPTRPMSGLMDSVLDRLRSFRSDNGDINQSTIDTRRRRRSSWRPFSNNNNSRDNGVDDDAINATGAATRSWIIYVLGGTYPENHPLLTTPSLFSDSPSYEDMLLLSNLIGPAKPETASAADLDSAGSTYTVSENHAQLEERCQVCLSEYEIGDSCRTLSKCLHYYHQECIDEWLTTGRNNCPLCRSETAARTEVNPEPVV